MPRVLHDDEPAENNPHDLINLTHVDENTAFAPVDAVHANRNNRTNENKEE